MLYELRHYDTDSDRGLGFVVRRFGDHVLPLWERHCITPVGFWTAYAGPVIPRLTYVLAWEDLAQRQDRWEKFQADPEWCRVRDETNAARGGSPIHTITNSILRPTPRSPLPTRDNQPARLSGGIFELRTYSFRDQADLAQCVEWIETLAMPLIQKHRMHVMASWTTEIGVTPRLTYMLVFESQTDRERAWASYRTDPAWPAVEEALYPGGRCLITHTENCLMRGTEFSGWR